MAPASGTSTGMQASGTAIGIEFVARKARGEPEAEQRGKSERRERDVEHAMGQQRLRTAFERRPERREQRIERRRVIEVVGFAGELERVRIEQAHRCSAGQAVPVRCRCAT